MLLACGGEGEASKVGHWPNGVGIHSAGLYQQLASKSPSWAPTLVKTPRVLCVCVYFIRSRSAVKACLFNRSDTSVTILASNHKKKSLKIIGPSSGILRHNLRALLLRLTDWPKFCRVPIVWRTKISFVQRIPPLVGLFRYRGYLFHVRSTSPCVYVGKWRGITEVVFLPFKQLTERNRRV